VAPQSVLRHHPETTPFGDAQMWVSFGFLLVFFWFSSVFFGFLLVFFRFSSGFPEVSNLRKP
jgi:hypothetical protein